MINIYIANDDPVNVKSDLAGGSPVYVFLPNDNSKIFFSTSIKDLFGLDEVLNELHVSDEGLSFLLQIGVVPPPLTVYKNLFVIGSGDVVNISTRNGKVSVDFDYSFIFTNKDKGKGANLQYDKNFILSQLASYVEGSLDKNKKTFLFHSSGKDSNMIALALAKNNQQKDITLVTHKSTGDKDESFISKQIAKKLGFKHVILNNEFDIKRSHLDLENYFSNITLPVVDSVTMAYPLYLAQLPELQDSNIIDGGGNDIYMQTPLVKSDFNKYYLSRVFSPLRPIVEKFISSESRLNPLTKTYIEWWSGFGGLTFGDSKRIFKNATNSRKYLQNEIEKRKTIDKTTLKTDFLTTIMAAEQHIRKFRTASDVYRSNAILPFSSEKLAKYFHSMPTEQLFNRKTGKNKLILREILKQEIDLDSDALGKYGYEFDFWKVIESLGGDVKKEVVECSLWDHDEITILCNKFYSVIHSDSPNSKRAQAWIHRLYLISSWYNKNKYIKK